MPRRSTIPVPNLPGVSHAGRVAERDASASAQAIGAQTSAIQAGLSGAAGLLHQRNQKIEKEEAEAAEAKARVAQDLYSSKVNIFLDKHEVDSKASWDAFVHASKTASPDEIMGMYLDHAERTNSSYENGIQDIKEQMLTLSKEDQVKAKTQLDEIANGFEGIQKRDSEAAKIINSGRTFEVEANWAKKSYENNWIPGLEAGSYEENIQNEVTLKKATDTLRKHFPDEREYNEIIEGIQSKAVTSKASEMARKANKKEDLEKAEEFFNSYSSITNEQQNHSFIIQEQAAVGRIARVRTQLINEFTDIAESGNELPQERMEQAVLDEYITQQESDNFVKLATKSVQKTQTQLSLQSFENNTLPYLRNRFDQLYPEGKDKNPIALLEDFERGEEIVRSVSKTAREVALGQHELLGYLSKSVFKEDDSGSIWSKTRHYGEYIERNVPDNLKQRAIDTYSQFIIDGQSALDYKDGEETTILSMTSFATEGEEAIGNLFKPGIEPTQDQIDATLKPIHDKWIETIVLEEVRDTPSPKASFSNIPQSFINAGGTPAQWAKVDNPEIWQN